MREEPKRGLVPATTASESDPHPMVHVRLNEREANPNPFVNFVSPLPAVDADDARELLRALAAQVKPVMKDHGYTVNSFEEYEHNPVFLGRNWNAGETIEIVLRRPGGSFYPTQSLLNTLCHELAHITHMNHSRDFHVLWAQLRREVEELQARGYFGDGMWSAGTRLGDGATVHQADLPEEDAPEYICGGAHKQSRRRAFRRRRNIARAGPSTSTGPQTEKRGKPGRRIRGDAQFVGDGHAVNEGLDGDAKTVGIGFRKKAGSKSARDARAAAAERRLAQLAAGPSSKPDEGDLEDTGTGSDDDDGEDGEGVPKETDQDRRQMLLDSMKDDGDDDDALEQLRTSNGQRGLVTCGKRAPSAAPAPPAEPPRKKRKLNTTRPKPAAPKPSLSDAEDEARERAAMEMAQGNKYSVGIIHTRPPDLPEPWKCWSCARDNPAGTYKCPGCDKLRTGTGHSVAHDFFWQREGGRWDEQRAAAAARAAKAGTPPPMPEPLGKWVCKICTLINPPLAPLCGACETARARDNYY